MFLGSLKCLQSKTQDEIQELLRYWPPNKSKKELAAVLLPFGLGGFMRICTTIGFEIIAIVYRSSTVEVSAI